MLISDHIVKAYDDDLNRLITLIVEMGKLVENHLLKAIEAIMENNISLAEEVIEGDIEINKLENKIDTGAVRLIALRQPVASDLRNVIAALKISSHLERMGDYATNIARRVQPLSQMGPLKYAGPINRLGKLVQEMTHEVIKAYTTLDDKKAISVWTQDHEVDEIYNGFVRELLTYMMEDPRNISPCTHLLFIAKNIERIGDHATDIAEHIHYLIHGTLWSENIQAKKL